LEPSYRLWSEGEGENLVAYFRFKRKGWAEERTEKFALKEAKTAGLIKPESNWQKWPKRMCESRVAGFVIKDYFADVMLGCPLEHERDDDERPASSMPTPPPLAQAPPAAPDPLLQRLSGAAPTDAIPVEATVAPEPEPEP